MFGLDTVFPFHYERDYLSNTRTESGQESQVLPQVWSQYWSSSPFSAYLARLSSLQQAQQIKFPFTPKTLDLKVSDMHSFENTSTN